jgi:hypothetical protein
MSTPEAQWWLAGLADGRTHKGTYSTATRSVHALCGIEFVPMFGRALSGNPPDPDQICGHCYRAAIRQGGERR